MISGLVLKYLNGECFVIRRGYETTLPVSSSFCLTVPLKLLREIDVHLHDGLDVVGACRKAGISDKTYYGAVRRMRTRIGSLAQPESMRSIIDVTQ